MYSDQRSECISRNHMYRLLILSIVLKPFEYFCNSFTCGAMITCLLTSRDQGPNARRTRTRSTAGRTPVPAIR